MKNHEYIAELDGPQSRILPGGIIQHGKGDAGVSSTTPDIPAELKPLANLYVQQASDIAQTPFQAYQGQRYADLNQTQNLGIGMVQDRALNGSQTMNNAESNLNQFIQGGQTNPYLDAMVAKAQGSVVDQWNNMTKPQTETAMRNSGSFGNSGLQQTLQNQQKQAIQTGSDIATQMYGQAYGQDQQNRMQAIGMAPTFGNAAYQDAGQLLNAGNIQQQQDQNNKDFAFDQYQQGQDYPFKQLQATGGIISQNMGSKTTQSGGGK